MKNRTRNPNNIGLCYLCRRPVPAVHSARIVDRAVSEQIGRKVRRLAHAGACAMELEDRIGRGVGFGN